MKCALCIVGQIARLELASKIKLIVNPTIYAGHELHLFLSLYSGNPKFVNKGKDIDIGPYYNHTSTQLSEIIRIATNISTIDTEIRKSPPWFLGDVKWARRMDKDPRQNVARQQMHLSQWSQWRLLMFKIEAQEQNTSRFEIILKIRDDSTVILPWIPPNLSFKGITTLQCLGHGGEMDANFIVHRNFAWQILEGMSAEWYLSHSTMTPNLNPETWLRSIIKKWQVPRKHVQACDLPFVSTRYSKTQNSSICIKDIHWDHLQKRCTSKAVPLFFESPKYYFKHFCCYTDLKCYNKIQSTLRNFSSLSQ